VYTGKTENFELFEFGRRLYVKLLGNEPCLSYDHFTPEGKKRPEMPAKTDNSIDENLLTMVYKMIHPNKMERTRYFPN